MTDPRPEEFVQFDRLLRKNAPEGYTPWYFRVREGSKAPATKFGSWKDESARLSPADAVQWMEDGGNVGIAGTDTDRLVNVDIDDEDETTIDDLKPTLIARSRSRTGVHGWYFREEGEEIPNIPTDDAGEVRTSWQYVVAPGSYVETDPAEAPDDAGDVGFYTIARSDPVATITLAELPDVFRETRKKDEKRNEKLEEIKENYTPPESTDGNSALYGVTAEDVVRKEGGGSVKPDDRWASIFHGSDSGENMSLSDEGKLNCWRHCVAHNGLQALAVLSDYDGGCKDVGSPHEDSGVPLSSLHNGDSHIWHAWKYAKERGYIPDDDPVPYRALTHLVREMGVAPKGEIPEQYDPENGERLPAYAYNAAISTIENRHELDSGREKVDQGESQTPDVYATQAAQQSAAADGGEEEAGDNDESTDDDANDESESGGNTLRDRIADEVLRPLDPPEESEVEQITQKVARDKAADIFCEEMSFVRPRESTRGWRDSLYIYIDGNELGRMSEAGIYEPNAKAELERIAEGMFGALADNAFVSEFVGKVERRSRVRARTLQPDEHRLVVNNGILNLTTGDLSEHTPEEFHRAKVEHDYDPDAECPRIDEFFHSVVDDDDVDTLYRFIAHALYKGYPESKAAMLLGDGANGKSVFLSLVEEFVGEFNVSGRSLQDITEYRWAANDLVGKMANVHADMSDQNVDSMRMFKQLTGEDTVDADVKYEKPVKFTNHATMLFACNEMPVLKDDTQGNWRRWVLINFPNTFDDDDPAAKDAVSREQLESELFAESELKGLLARCVEEIKEWQGGRAWFPDVPGWRDTRSKMRRAAEPVFDFAEACLVNDDESYVEKGDVRAAYREYATREGLPKMKREEFGRKLHMLADYNVEGGQKRASDGPGMLQVYKGVDLNGRGRALIDDEDEGFDPREAVMQTVRDEDGWVPEALVVERLHADYGIDNGRGEHALDTLKANGRLLRSEKHGVEGVEVT